LGLFAAIAGRFDKGKKTGAAGYSSSAGQEETTKECCGCQLKELCGGHEKN
jgi:hypothetical protein